MARKALSKKTRFEVFKRDLFACQYCGRTPPSVTLHVDHIEPVARGGDNRQNNLITSCVDCNLGKAANPLTTVLPSLKVQAEALRERRAQIDAYGALLEEEKARLDDDVWRVAAVLGWPDECLKSRLASIRTFVKKIPVSQVVEAAEIAVARKGDLPDSDLFRYFCGIGWAAAREGGVR